MKKYKNIFIHSEKRSVEKANRRLYKRKNADITIPKTEQWKKRNTNKKTPLRKKGDPQAG